MILFAITVLYFTNVIQTSVQWLMLKKFIGPRRRPKLQTSLPYAELESGPSWSNIVTNINFLLAGSASDSLLVSLNYLRYE